MAAIPDAGQQRDAIAIAAMMEKATKVKPKMWGANIVGFGDVHLEYASGRELDWFAIGLSPRKTNVTLYFMPGIERYGPLLQKLGKHKIGKGCLYIKRLEDVDTKALADLIQRAVDDGC